MENMEQKQISPDKQRALVITGKIDYLLDHYLDQESNLKKSELTQGATLRDQLEKINEDDKTTVIMATHNAAIVNHFKKRVVVLEKGKIEKDEKEGKYESD